MDYNANEPIQISDYWRLVDDLTVLQAALLAAGEDPEKNESNIIQDPKYMPRRVYPISIAISQALRKGHIKGKNVGMPTFDDYGNGCYPDPETTSITDSTVERDSLTEWLASRGIRTGFFFPEKQETGTPDYLDPNHPRYAPKLAAAVKAWLANPEIRGKTKKQAIDKWAREHAAQFGLTNDDGLPIEKAMEEIAIVANWNTSGGAPKTPTA